MDDLIKSLPDSIQQNATASLEKITKALHDANIVLPYEKPFAIELVKVIATSQFAANILINSPEHLIYLREAADLNTTRSLKHYREIVKEALNDVEDEKILIERLREIRRREMLRIAWRDLCQLAEPPEIMEELSDFAVSCTQETLEILHHWQIKTLGTPVDKHNHPQKLLVIACGKLGARELNFSSDIDLIICYPETGMTIDTDKPIENERFFILLVQRFIKAFASITNLGFVFRVDLRLRPFGSSGPLVMNFRALQDYYHHQGRDWERYALAKGRIIYGEQKPRKILQQIIKSFVFRRYVDYSAIEALRKLKQSMRREAFGQKQDIKRCQGGIRELEFIVQSFQLIRGGKEPWLQETSLLKLLPKLASEHSLGQEVVAELQEAYLFFRNTEHRIQMYEDAHTHLLPQEESQRARLAYAMDYSSWDEFMVQLQHHRRRVQYHYNQTIAITSEIPEACKLPVADENILMLFKDDLDEEIALSLIEKIGFAEKEATWELLKTFINSFAVRSMDEYGAKRLKLLFPQVIACVVHSGRSLVALKRILQLLEAIARRSVYLLLLLENLQAMPHLVALMAESSWISNQLVTFPILLDELMDKETLYAPYSTAMLFNELRQNIISMPGEDLEAQMECMRRFKLMQTMRVAASDIKSVLPLMKVSDHLTNLANVLVIQAANIAWRRLTTRHGYPTFEGQSLERDDFAIIAYGKLGGIELSYGSDLDLVFLHADIDSNALTDGEVPISNAEFFIRLAQRIIHILNTSTTAGVLYAVDTRLRPSGTAGLLVGNIESYANYQHEKAWTWEHQALVRARIISGSEALYKRFNEIRHNILVIKRDSHALASEMISMRSKMRESSMKAPENFYDLDQVPGGIKDIEFISQFIVLNWAHVYPSLAVWSDNIRIIKDAAKVGLLTAEESECMQETYIDYRRYRHHQLLKDEDKWVEAHLFQDERAAIIKIWDRFLGT